MHTLMNILHGAWAVLVPSVFLLLATVSWVATVFQIPGNWIMLLLAFLFGLYEHFHAVAWWVLLIGLVICGVGEIVEWGTGYLGPQRMGGSRLSGVGAILGSIVGALFGAAFGYGLGAIPGTILGAFAGALIVEIIRFKLMTGALKAGFGAAVGRAMGLAAKLGLGGAFLALLYFRVLYTAFAR
ncbi:MAG: DUF456 domain-containing protein [Acidobacteriota bacterium]